MTNLLSRMQTNSSSGNYLSMRTFACLLIAVVFSGLAVGCRKVEGPADLPVLHPVVITVLQDGQPLVEASVALFAEGSKWAVGGSTDAKGRALIRTLGKYPGAPEGTYKVCIHKELIDRGGLPSNDPSAAAEPTIFYDLVDQQFKLSKTTPLEVTVVVGKNQPAAFDVGKPIRKALPTLN